MRIGITAYDMHALDFQELAKAADETGFDSLWLGEHLLLPIGYDTPHPTVEDGFVKHVGPVVSLDTELVDPLVQLGAAAAVTGRIKLGTAIFVLPLRHPLAVARSVCTLQELADGRFILGLGFGWLEEEFNALDIPFKQRVGRFEESIEILHRSWEGGEVTFGGKYFSVSGVQVTQRETKVPLILGGNSDRALRRAVRLGDGWLSSGTPTFEESLRLRSELQWLHQDANEGRPFAMMFRMGGADPADARQYEDAGFENLLIWAKEIWPAGESLTAKRAALFAAAESLGLS
jgi:probable F420-dependent oxidoreductase